VMVADGAYTNGACSGDAMPIVHDNKVFSPTANITECGMSLQDWQAKGNDPGTTAAVTPSDQYLIALAQELLSQ